VRGLASSTVVPQKMRAYDNVSCTDSAATQKDVHINLNFFALTNPKQNNVEKTPTSFGLIKLNFDHIDSASSLVGSTWFSMQVNPTLTTLINLE